MLPEKLSQQKVFYYFERLSAIPHGSGNMGDIAQFCENFAKEHSLKYIKDAANNVIIFKNSTVGYENYAPVILQGHLDMVCQKMADCNIDFQKDGLDLYVDGDFLKARGTTLGADNAIAVAMVLAILESDNISHPPIEAVFTTDEEIGMIGARALDMSVLKAKRMINLDSETEGTVTVSCAGGSDFEAKLPLKKVSAQGAKVSLKITGLIGGHSGVEINKNRENANLITARIISSIKPYTDFGIISINGGDKANAIPNCSTVDFCVKEPNVFCENAKNVIDIIKQEICDREPDFDAILTTHANSSYDVFEKDVEQKLLQVLLCAPNGVTEMSASIKGLVQTSLNLGILETTENNIIFHFALRSNKKSALIFLESKLGALFDALNIPYETFGHYPPWEYKADSLLRDLYCEVYSKTTGNQPTVIAIHAGLECGVFADGIKDFDCISIGPNLYEIHTTRERLSISSTQNFYSILLEVLEKLNP
ncbi:MAG: aminoacyl-histidine dipeptidase [Clostridia bacterium]|nr:aminoacyl-histidine dipeptidase [Clostridia bacterium]